MANKKINELVTRTPSLSDLILVGDPSSGYSYKATVTALATIIETDIADGFVTISTTQTISGAKTFSNNLTLTSVANAATTQTKFLTLNGSNVVNYRTGAEVLADIGGQGTLTLTTTGTSGAATLVGNTLNIPQYQSTLTNPVTGTGTTNYLPKFTGSTTIGNSQLIDDGTTVFLGTSGSLPNVKMIISTTSQRALELISTSGNALFVSSGGAFVMTVTNGTWSSQFTQAGRLELGGDLSITTIANATVDTDKFLVSDSGVIKYRTGAEVLSDIGGASSASISGTTNYIPKFTSSSAIGNSVLYESTAGQIGFGTITPINATNYKFITTNATSGSGLITQVNAVTSLYVYSNASGSLFSEQRNLPLIYEINGTEQMRLTSTGLGIGTSSPAYKLDVAGSGRARGLIVDGANNGNTSQFAMTRTDVSWGIFNETDLRFYSDNTNTTSPSTLRMSLTASGNLGLGVTPSAWFSVYKALQIGNYGAAISGQTNDQALTLWSNAYPDASNVETYTTTNAANKFRMSSGAFAWYIAPSGTAGNAITFTQAMTLFSTGNLAVGGTTDNGYKLDVNGTGRFTNSANSATLNLLNNNGYPSIINMYTTTATSTARNWAIFTNGTNWGDLEFKPSAANGGDPYTTGTVALRLSSTGAATFSSSGSFGNGTLNGANFIIKGQNGVAQSSGTTTQAVLRLSSGTGLYNVLDFGTNESLDYSWIQSTRANSLGTYDKLLLNPNGGNVGIGTTSPQAILSVKGSTNNTVIEFDNGGATKAFMRSYDRTAGAYREYEMLADYLLFSTGSSPSERMRITSAGRVLIGTTTDVGSPFNLQVGGRILQTGTEFGFSGDDDKNITVYSNRALNLRTNDVTRMTITGGGNVGIGTTSPSALLHLGSSGSAAQLWLQRTDGYNPVKLIGGTLSDGSGFKITMNATDAFAITSGGSVGIGTTSPASKLHIESSTFDDFIKLTRTGVGSMGITATNPRGIQTTDAAGNFVGWHVTATGNVGIGTNSPARNLTVSTSTDTYISALGSTTGEVGVLFGDSGNDAIGRILYVNAGDFMQFYTNNSERMRLSSGGELLINTTSNSATSNVGSKFVSNGRLFTVSSYSDNTQESLSMYSTTASAYRFYVGWGGTVYATNTTISAISDIRYKENVRDLDSALNKLMLLKPRVFDWKEGMGKNIKNDKGFIAQEFEQIFPELVDKWKEKAPQGEEPYKSIRQDLIPYLVKAIQELKAEIETLKNK